jgi:hypothetical protein
LKEPRTLAFQWIASEIFLLPPAKVLLLDTKWLLMTFRVALSQLSTRPSMSRLRSIPVNVATR